MVTNIPQQNWKRQWYEDKDEDEDDIQTVFVLKKIGYLSNGCKLPLHVRTFRLGCVNN